MVLLKVKQQIDKLLPYGMIATRKWLLSQGMSRHAIDNSLKSNKFRSLAVGVYTRHDTTLSWQSIIYSLQHVSSSPIYVGGVSALELLGLSHYLSSAKGVNVHLYSEKQLPLWVNKLDQGLTFTRHSTKRLWPENVFSLGEFTRSISVDHGLTSIKVSCPEKACLEMLAGVPKNMSFDHANKLMQGMTSLSPKKLETLLTVCKSIKVKRLFLWLAERQGYAWFKKLDTDSFNLGTGKRVIAQDGKLDKKYLITVPEHLYE